MESALSMERVFIKKLTAILEVNLENEHFKVKELAEALGVSRSQLHRKLHAICGKSTSQFIREFRLEKAMTLLQDNVATASEISYRVGFNSPTYFNTCFHEYYGYPPGEVKFRDPNVIGDDKEGQKPEFMGGSQSIKESTSVKKNLISKRVVWINSIGIVLLSIFSYYLYQNYKDPNPLEIHETVNEYNSIAVLPFKNWSGDPELEYISDGMTDAVISRLTKIQSIYRVIPFTSMIKYKETDKSIPQIAQELGVRHILQGNLQLSGNRLKINLQLIDGPSNDHFWSDGYEGEWESNEIFDIQAEVAENVAKNMNVEIKDKELEAIQIIPTQNKEAYNYWVQANFQALKYTKNGMKNAITLYENAIRLDSAFYEAYTNLAYLYLLGGASWGLFDEQEAWRNAKNLLLKAYQIDSTDSAVKIALNDGLYMYEWDFERMEKEYKTNSNIAIIYGLQTGRYEESLTAVNNGLKENPASVYDYILKAQALFLLNRTAEAKDLLKQIDKLFDDNIMYLRVASRYYFYMGEYENSRALLTKIMNNFPDRPPVILWLNAVHEDLGKGNSDINKYLDELRHSYESGVSGSPAWFIALYYCHIKDYDKAFDWLRKSYNRHEVEMIWLREEPLLRPLRNDKRYLELYAKVGFPMAPHSIPE